MAALLRKRLGFLERFLGFDRELIEPHSVNELTG
jgi:hypothetical protein